MRELFDQGLWEQDSEQRQRAERAAAFRAQLASVQTSLDLARRRAEREQREAEAVRKARPEPRGVLRDAHRLRSEAEAELARSQQNLERMRSIAVAAESRGDELAAARTADDAAAAARLVEQLEAGAEPVIAGHAADAGALAAAEHELAIAEGALRRLEDALRSAEDQFKRCSLDVDRQVSLEAVPVRGQ